MSDDKTPLYVAGCALLAMGLVGIPYVIWVAIIQSYVTFFVAIISLLILAVSLAINFGLGILLSKILSEALPSSWSSILINFAKALSSFSLIVFFITLIYQFGLPPIWKGAYWDSLPKDPDPIKTIFSNAGHFLQEFFLKCIPIYSSWTTFSVFFGIEKTS